MVKSISRQLVLDVCRSEGGSISTIFALSLLPLVAVSGAAVDYSRAMTFKSQLQSAVDATALAIVSGDQAAFQTLLQNELVGLETLIDDVEFNLDGNRSRVIARHDFPTAFMQMIGFESIPMQVSAAAEFSGSADKVCALALNETDPRAFSVNGSADFLAAGCAVHSNSTDPEGLYIGNNATAVADRFCSRGGYAAPSDFDQPISGKCGFIDDPLAGAITVPDSSGCDFNNFSVNPNQEVTLQGGIYCGGLSIRGTVKFEAGAQIVIKDGDFQINSQAVVSGEDVFFYLTGSKAGFTFNGGAEIDLHAARSDDNRGVLIYQDPVSSTGSENRLNGSAQTVFHGAIYTPANALRINGGSGFGQDSINMPIIADTITITGNSDVRITIDDEEMVAPFPDLSGGVMLTH